MYTTVRDNERSHAIDVISQINEISSKYNLLIKKAGGERTISTLTLEKAMETQEKSTTYSSKKRKVMFPDVFLYGDVQKTQILQGWELKLPDTLITDEIFIKDAQRKAVALGLNSCFIWNFTAGTLYVKKANGVFEIAKQWNNTNHIKSRLDVETYRLDWEKEISEIIIEINEFFVNGIFKGAALGDIISDTVIATLVSRNKQLVADNLESYTASNTIANAHIEQWWKEVECEYAKDESNKYNAYSKIIILNWTNRIVFAHLIKRYHNEARKVLLLKNTTTPDEANGIFNDITNACDFYSIFSEVFCNTNIPENTWLDLMELNVFLEDNGIEEIEQSSLQMILEGTVSTTKREIAGQYTTPSKLAEILAKITITNLNGNVIDPCCGTGSIPKETLLYKKERLGLENGIKTTWAADKYTYPLQIANLSLTSPESINIPNRVFQQNALNLSEREMVALVNPIDGKLIDIKIPVFDVVLSNLPFISFEKISDDDKAIIKSIILEVKANTGITLSFKSDIYCFLMFSLYNIISENGRAGFITSNSWIGTIWGKDFYKALNYYYNIEQVHISENGRWFDNAQVVTTILVLSKKSQISNENNKSDTIFYSWKKTLADIKVNNNTRDSIINSALLSQNIDKDVMNMNKYSYEDTMKILAKNLSLNALFHNVEWITRISSCLIPLSEVFEVFRGERRGWDDMFYPKTDHGIEKEYIKNVLKNGKSVATLCAKADCDAFCCSDTIKTLISKNKTGALKWIKKYESGVNGVGKPLPSVLEKPNMQWYEMQDTSTAEIFTMMNPDKRLFFSKFDVPTFINQRLIGLRKKDGYSDIKLNHALLNSVLGLFYIEAVGFGRGLGALDINKNSIKKSFMLNPNLVNKNDRNLILEKFEPLLARDIMTTDKELFQKDRKDFDMIVLSAFGIEDYYESIKESLISMQKARLSVK